MGITYRSRLSSFMVVVFLVAVACVEPGVGTTSTSTQGFAAASLPDDVRAIVERFDIPVEQVAWVPPDVWTEIHVDPADVVTEETAGGYDEQRAAWARWTAECYTQAGYAARAFPPGSGQVRFEGSNAAAFATSRAKQICDAESIRRFPPEPPPQTREEWAAYYERDVARAECLAREGYDVSQPPSLDAYIDDGGAWDPYEEIGDLVGSGEEWDRLLTVCPPP